MQRGTAHNQLASSTADVAYQLFSSRPSVTVELTAGRKFSYSDGNA